jgi:hypothetical protein
MALFDFSTIKMGMVKPTSEIFINGKDLENR